LKVRDEQLAPWPRTPAIVREHIAAYYAMITHLDDQVGRVIAALDEAGESGNTIVVFAGDNGLAAGRHGLLGKQNLYDHSVRVPLIMAGPGIPPGRRNSSLCYLLDVFPTLGELTGVAAPQTVEGRSLAAAFRDPRARLRDSLFFAYRGFQRGVRTDEWKLIRYNAGGRETTQLFQVKKDPWELKNLAGDARFAGRLKEMNALLRDWMNRVDDPADLDKPDWGGSLRG
jgi:arylsulfatase A-like enzyme